MEQINYTDEYLKFLIEEEKFIVEPPKKLHKDDAQYFRNSFGLMSIDEKRFYNVFIRIHKIFKENFSIGLIHKPSDRENFQLVRFNGNHGETLTGLLPYNRHRDYHIHEMTADDLENGILEPNKSYVTKEYASFEQAICAFCKFVKIRDYDRYFKNCAQYDLFSGV